MARYRSLDGLRGIAALAVVAYHALMTVPAFSAILENGGGTPPGWLTYSPLHLFWAGPEAVAMFFTLSGFVLVLPFLGGSGLRTWLAYYGQRLTRLYLPVLASLAFAAVLAVLIPRGTDPAASWYLNQHATSTPIADALRDAPLIRGVGWLNIPLWTMRLEIVFSLVLPLFVLGAVLFRGHWVIKLALVIALGTAMPGQTYLVVFFAVGAILASARAEITDLCRKLSMTSGVLLTVASLMLLIGRWFIGSIELTPLQEHYTHLVRLLGAALLVTLAFAWEPLARCLVSRVVQPLGPLSFSLYLVHEPIVVSLAWAMGGNPPAVLIVALSFLVSVPVAWVFYRLVEAPTHRLSKRIGRRLQGNVEKPVTHRPAVVEP